jgi:hypothetical protein
VLQKGARRGAVISGAIVAGVPYVLGIVIAGGGNFGNGSDWLVVPGVGPWLTLYTRKDDCGLEACDRFIRTYLILDGIMQDVGLALLIWGIASPTTRLVRADLASIHVLPTLSLTPPQARAGWSAPTPSGGGLTAFGTF